MMAPMNGFGRGAWGRVGLSAGWQPQGTPILAQPPFEGPLSPGAQPIVWTQDMVAQGGLLILKPERAATPQAQPAPAQPAAGPADWLDLAGGWLGSAWATFRSGLRRLAEAMGPTPPTEGAAGAAAVAGLELVGGVAQTALAPVVAAMGAAGQAGVAIAEAARPALGGLGEGLARVGEAAAAGAQAVGQAFATGAEAVASSFAAGAQAVGQVFGRAWDRFWGAFQGQARR